MSYSIKFTSWKILRLIAYLGLELTLNYWLFIRTRPGSSLTAFRFQSDVVSKVRELIKVSSIPFEKIFYEEDTDKSGKLSNIEFCNAIMKPS